MDARRDGGSLLAPLRGLGDYTGLPAGYTNCHPGRPARPGRRAVRTGRRGDIVFPAPRAAADTLPSFRLPACHDCFRIFGTRSHTRWQPRAHVTGMGQSPGAPSCRVKWRGTAEVQPKSRGNDSSPTPRREHHRLCGAGLAATQRAAPKARDHSIKGRKFKINTEMLLWRASSGTAGR